MLYDESESFKLYFQGRNEAGPHMRINELGKEWGMNYEINMVEKSLKSYNFLFFYEETDP